ncbi:zinc ribbon domain-containing protein [Mycolicibacterium mengxianglii]|uniref:zinc ribbon domain-containing protein n=1 Tax=Mycolicibacterium mengxianglii TaxID=2736649 RepID=UPI0018D17272|nr:zinc ribbon domain-containing protein [Mycolicibacterium mengxianglii]
MSAPGMVECPVCQVDVPAGEYCGLCGMPLDEHRSGDGPHWLRARAFSAASGQRLLAPALTSSLFPHLPPRSRKVFLMALGLLVAALIVATFLRMPAALVAVASLGLPLLFALYLWESGVSRDYPRAILTLTVILGITLGVGWVLLTGAAVARAYGVPLGAGIAGGLVLRDGIAIPLGSMLLMLAPAVVARSAWRGRRESLDGYVIGAMGALTFTAAATLTRLAPQFTTGMINRARPLDGLLVEAGIRGIAMPLTAAAVGGLIGTALWFTRPPTKALENRAFVRGTLILIAVVVIAIYASLGVVDVARLPQVLQLALHLTLTAFALLALRVGLHLALLHEAHDEVRIDEPILCIECNHVVPDAAFCARCGAAMHASSRRSRRIRRDDRPVRVAEQPPAGKVVVGLLPGYSLYSGEFEAAQPPKASFRTVALALGITIVVLAGGLVGLSGLISKPAPKYVCPPDCGSPPMNRAVEINPRFTSADGAFSVSYPVEGSAYEISKHDNGVTAVLRAGDGGTMQLFSRPAGGRTPKEIAIDLVNGTYPDTKTAYEIPNAMVGYQNGYGLAADVWPQGAMSSYSRMRVIVMVAVKNDLALIAGAVGPYRAFGPDFGSGKPSAANLQLALDMGKYVNSFSWRGDPPR